VDEDSGIYASEDSIKVHFPCGQAEGADPHAVEQYGAVDLDFIDEIYFSSSACIRNFGTIYKSIPEKIIITTADQEVNAEYRKRFSV